MRKMTSAERSALRLELRQLDLRLAREQREAAAEAARLRRELREKSELADRIERRRQDIEHSLDNLAELEPPHRNQR